MNLLSGLNEPQRAAVEHENGPLLIFAGAGSGKTRTLTHRIAHLVLERGVPAARILAVTFTNKAAREMRERLQELIGKDASRLWVGTFHAMSAQLLRIHGHHIGLDPRFVIFDSDDQLRLIKDIARELDIASDRYPPARLLGRISDAKNNLQTPQQCADSAVGPLQKTVARVYAHYQKRLTDAHALDFDDLIGQAVRLLRESEVSRNYWSDRFLHVLIDEFQDVNQAQFEWAKMLAAKHRNICVVGDDDQCVAPGALVATPDGERAIEDLKVGDEICGAAGRGTMSEARVEKVRARHYEGPLLQISTRGGRQIRLTPHHMCFARLGINRDVHYVYLMYRADKGYRLGIAVGARSDGRKMVTGLQVRANQEGADKMWILRVCPSRAEATFYEQLWAFEFGIPTTVFHVVGRDEMLFTQPQIDAIYARIDTRLRAARLMEALNIDASHPHYRPKGLISADKTHRLVVHMTAFGGNAPSLQSPWFRHRVWLNTSCRVLENQLLKSGIETRPGNRETWRVERSCAAMERTAHWAQKIARAAGGENGPTEIARWAALSSSDKFAFLPASHLHPTMMVPVENDGVIEDDEITAVETIEYSGPVYDLDVANLHNFCAGGIVVHNSIYAWRGADVKIILDFEQQYPDAQVIRLEQNYRSTQNILDAAYGVIANNFGRKAKRLWTDTSGGAQLLLHGAANAQEEALWVVRQIELLKRERTLNARDFAILCRVNAQSRPFEEAFMRARLPLKLVGTQRFYDRKEIRDIVSYLKVLYNPNDDLALARVINVPPRGIGATTVEKLKSIARESGLSLLETILHSGAEVLGRPIDNKLESLRGLIGQLQERLQKADTVVEILESVVYLTDYYEFLRGEKTGNGNDRIANVEEFIAAANDFDERMSEEDWTLLETEGGSAPEKAPYLGLFLESSALESGRESGSEEDDATSLMTLHSAKGLEFPIVFMVGMEQGLLPHARALWGENASTEDLEEERRLCYVGLTRAQSQAILTYATQRTLHGRTESTQPSQFMDELPQHLLDKSGLARGGSVQSYATRWDAPERSRYGPRATSGNTPVANSASSSAREVTKSKFSVGDRVKHPSFGEGVVVATSPSGGASEWAEVAFLSEEVGKKKLAVSFAPLEKL